ncbi:serine hydrolase domain-containing protein [Fulvimonas soli]|jgi:beta-lactamase class C|uniref:Beta-lactamase class C n=1 Tax=Fulvimonas soli TaxID=155197 RepID=A0A316I7U5_9GAMM|nr:serine hydrolase domain-containing protein [Fulvimonas soli]PWK88481.1 beta-lactamase class C [Fulvimonas soli]TNY26869.1 serine hydrolase [Fulvimonas soli]
MSFSKLSLLIAGLLGLAAPLHAAGPAAAPPAAGAAAGTALPPQRVQETLAAYRQWLDRLDQRHAVAGLATAVVVNDKVVFEHTLGYANASSGEKVTPDTVFRLASLSKAFATGLTAILVADGKLSWDTHLVNVLPFFKLKSVPDTEQATVADILGQRLGLPRNTYDNMLEDDIPYEELVRKLDEVDLACGVGRCYGYQNVAFSLIGDVVYAMTGDFFYREVDKRIFYPLGMKTASYGRDALESSRSWARPHRPYGHSWVPFEPKENYYRVAPAAGVNASLHDMEQWLIAQMGGRPDVLTPAMLRTLHAPGVPTPVELHSTPWRRARLTAAHYALGWRVFEYGGETLVFHAGAVEGYRTMIGFFPRYHAGVVTMWNSAGPVPSGLMPMVFDSLLGLPHVDWAGVEGDAPAAAAAPVRKSKRPAKKIRQPAKKKRRHAS